MKNTFFSLIIAAGLVSVSIGAKAANEKPGTPYVSPEAEGAIYSEFPSAKNISWADDEWDVYSAYFTQPNGNRMIATVDNDGNVLSVLTYYGAAHVPARLRPLLEKAYPGKTITAVTRFEQDYSVGMEESVPDVSYQVTLEDEGHWYVATVDGNSVHTTQTLDKE